MITWTEFVIRLLLAFVLGAGIGMERQWQKTRATIRINVLASVGAAIFVMTTALASGEGSLAITVAPIALGMSFISASIILQEKGNFRSVVIGITLWCAAAIGSLIGFGLFFPAYVSTVTVILANLIFQPIEQQTRLSHTHEELSNNKLSQKSESNHQQKSKLSPVQEIRYRCQVICHIEDEPEVLALLVQSVREKKLTLTGVSSKNLNNQEQNHLTEAEIQADFLAEGYKEQLELEQAVSVLKSQARVNSVSWQYLSEEEY